MQRQVKVQRLLRAVHSAWGYVLAVSTEQRSDKDALRPAGEACSGCTIGAGGLAAIRTGACSTDQLH